MPRHVEAYLDGRSLRDAAPRIWITQITEDAATLEPRTSVFPGWDGERLIRTERRSLTVHIECQVHEVHNLTARAAALDAIAAWAGGGGILTVSYRPHQRLRVTPTAVPALGAARDYTQTITADLTAYAVPYWEDMTVRTAEPAAAASGETLLSVPGSVDTPLDAEITPAAALTSLQITTARGAVALQGLSVAAGKKIILSHTEDDILTITADGTGVLRCRTAASADDLLIPAGPSTVAWTADAACAVKLMARGRYR